MCGIAGFFQSQKAGFDIELLNRLSESFGHRGPDDVGFLGWSDARVIHRARDLKAVQNHQLIFMHRRLSILDLSEGGWQPMSSHDGRYHIIYNGEIYNYLELRSELSSLGVKFDSSSDTEVLLEGYGKWGLKLLSRLVGMFSFAILDDQKGQVFLARDFFGIKPLYISKMASGFAFASEVKTLLQLPSIGRKVNHQKIYEYLRYNLTDHGETTFFKNIMQLPAGHFTEIDLANPTKFKFQSFRTIVAHKKSTFSFSQAAERTRELFLESVRLHLRSDVPVGAALSGGIDSSAIVMAMRHLDPKVEIHTFSYIADEPSLNEERWIDLVGERAKAQVHKIHPRPHELIRDLDSLILSQDMPFGSTSMYAQYRVFKLAHDNKIKVMLDGQGADELFGGYTAFLSAKLASMIRQGNLAGALKLTKNLLENPATSSQVKRSLGFLIPGFLQTPLRAMGGKELVPEWISKEWFKRHELKPSNLSTGGGPHILRSELDKSVWLTSLPMLLRYEDRNSMAFSIESRVPFLTPVMYEFAQSLPEEFLISSSGKTKNIFREAMRGIVPQEILDRKDKIGFATPELKWLATLRPWIEGVLKSDRAASVAPLELPLVSRQWELVLDGKAPFDFRLWRWINLIKWAEVFDVDFS